MGEINEERIHFSSNLERHIERFTSGLKYSGVEPLLFAVKLTGSKKSQRHPIGQKLEFDRNFLHGLNSFVPS
jgi:hypothetical protein